MTFYSWLAMAAVLAWCALLAVLLSGGSWGLIAPMAVLGVLGASAGRSHERIKEREVLAEHGLTKLTVGKDRVYVSKREDEA